MYFLQLLFIANISLVSFLLLAGLKVCLNTRNQLPCETNCNVFTCVRHYCSSQLLKSIFSYNFASFLLFVLRVNLR